VVGAGRPGEPTAAAVLADLDARGRWITGLGTNSHPYRGPGPATPAPGDFARTHVGDAHDTSPFPDDTLRGISTAAYLRNMSVLIRYLDTTGDRPARD
jgi:hypothetical protein